MTGQAAGLVALTRSIIDESQNTSVYIEADQNNLGTTFFRCLLTHESRAIIITLRHVLDPSFRVGEGGGFFCTFFYIPPYYCAYLNHVFYTLCC